MSAEAAISPITQPRLDPRRLRTHRIALGFGEVLVSLPEIALSGVLIVNLCAPHGYLLTGVVLGLWLVPAALITAFLISVLADMTSLPDKPDRGAGAAQQARLAVAWHAVSAAAGIPETAYSVFISKDPEMREMGAWASAGRRITVSNTTVRKLHAAELSGTLAHELGHHLLGLRSWRLLLVWYAMPVTVPIWLPTGLVGAAVEWLFRWAPRWLAVPIRTCATTATLIGTFGVLLRWVGPTTTAVVTAVLLVQPVLHPMLKRRTEYLCDRIAVDLGFGAGLASDFQRNLPRRFEWSVLRRMNSSHPSTTRRIRAIEARMRKLDDQVTA